MRRKMENTEDFGWGESTSSSAQLVGDLTARQKAELILEKEMALVEAERAKKVGKEQQECSHISVNL